MVFGSRAAKEKLEDTEIQCRFGDTEICLNFHKRVGPLRNGRQPIFVTILLPEFISDQAVRLTFSNFGDVVSVFKGRHKFNKDIRNGKRHVKIFPAGEDPAILPRKISFHGRIQRDVLFAEKVVLCYRCKTRHMLGENCSVATPITEDSSMSLAEQSDTPSQNAAPVQPESSVETQPSTESQQTPSPTLEGAREGDSSMTDGSGSDSDSGPSSESDDESESGLESSVGTNSPSGSSLDLPSRENLSVVQKVQVNKEQGSQKPGTVTPSKGDQTIKKPTPTSSAKTEKQVPKNKRTLKSLRDFPLPDIFPKWYRDNSTSIFRQALTDFGIKNNIDGFVEVVHAAAGLMHDLCLSENHFIHNLSKQFKRYCADNPNGPKSTIEKFGDYLYRRAMKVWPGAFNIIHERERYKHA